MRIIAQTYIILSLYLQLHCLIFKALFHRIFIFIHFYQLLLQYFYILFKNTLSFFVSGCALFFTFHSYFDSPSSVTISLRYEITLPSTSLPVFPFFSPNSRTPLSIMKPEISGKLIHIRKSIFNWRKACAGFSVAQNCTTLFFCCPSVSWFGPTSPLRAQRRKCVVKYLIWSIPSPPPATNPFLC